MRATILGISLFLSTLLAQAQIYNPVSWETEVKDLENGTFELLITATIEEGWHLYSQVLPSDDGPIATEFTFQEGEFEKIGKTSEPKAMTEYDPNFEMDLDYFEEEVTFVQQIKPTSNKAQKIMAEVYFMVCDAEKCLPPEYVDLEFDIPESALIASSEEGLEESEELAKSAADETEEELNKASGPEIVIHWKYRSEKVAEGEYELHFTAEVDEEWHLYSQHLPTSDGPIATAFYYKEGYELIGETEEIGELISDYDPNFDMDLNFYEGTVDFVQRIKSDKKVIKADFEFMVCTHNRCLIPEYIELEFDLVSGTAINALDKKDVEANLDVAGIIPYMPNVDLENPEGDCGGRKDISNVWMVFLFGFIGGLIALLTPCVFPMIPLTVSFFTKGDGGGRGIGQAVLYGAFIFIIYALISVPFHFNTDPEVLNQVATSVTLNIIFFIVFVVFAISFFGYFEITLPSSIANKADSASQTGGIIGIFFMAITLVIVSFSCTGPILGTVLGNALKSGPWPITSAMSGFGVALGLPFALFATFPNMMKKLPKSGGWLNSVKVVLAFVELAFALKFFSNADLVEQWGLVERETFFLIWTLIGIGCTAYLFGWIRFPHDSPIDKLSKTRLSFAILCLAFTIYIAPGVLKNPPWNHNALSGFPPPTFYTWYEKETFHAEFDDFDAALAKAQEVNKPILIDFTGWACVNCRKMEESVWTVDKIKEKLDKDFVLVSLYVDDKIKLPEEQQGVFEYEVNGKLKKKKIKTIGNKWATFQTQVFNNNSQPYYVMLSPDGYLLGNPVGYTPDVSEYDEFLECGLATFNNREGIALKN